MNTIMYRQATIEELDFLVELRIKELSLFSDAPLSKEAIIKTHQFYQEKMQAKECFTFLGYDQDILVTTGTVYFYDCLPSNDNHFGKVGYITNIWTKEEYRGRGLAGQILDQLIEVSKDKCGLLSLNSAIKAVKVYKRKGFIQNNKNMVCTWNK